MSDRLCFLLVQVNSLKFYFVQFSNISDRLQGDSIIEFFRYAHGIIRPCHLRKLPMGYFTEGNIGK